MRVLITGIDGFVGSHMAELLLEIPGVEVHGTVLAREFSRNIRHIASHLNLYEANILDADRMATLISKIAPDRIIHLAAQAFVPASIRNPMETFQANIYGALTVLDAARRINEREGKGPSVLAITTGEVYGKVPPEKQPITEDAPLRPANPYAASKASIDMIANQYRTTFGLDVTVARPFNHAGPRQDPAFVCSDFGKQLAMIAAGQSKPVIHVGNLDAVRDYTDVRDVVRAYWMLFEHNSEHGAFNVATGRRITIREVLETLIAISGIKVEIVSEQRKLRPYDVTFIGDSHLLRSLTGWEPRISFRQTLADVYAYWQHEVSASE